MRNSLVAITFIFSVKVYILSFIALCISTLNLSDDKLSPLVCKTSVFSTLCGISFNIHTVVCGYT